MLLSNNLVGPVMVLEDEVRPRAGGRGCGESAHLMLASASAGPDECVWAKIALDVGSDDLAGDALAGHEPLIRSRHDGVARGEEW